MRETLTEASIKSRKADPLKRIEISDALLPALRLVVAPTGVKSWAVRYKRDGVSKKLTLGRAMVGNEVAITLKDARTKARAALAQLQHGIDPAAQKQADRTARVAAARAERAAQEGLVENALEDFIARHVRTKKSGHEVERLLRVEVIPVWRGLRVTEISRRDVVKLLDAIHDRGAPTTARRVLANLSKCFNWLISRGFEGLDGNPCFGVRKPSPEVQRERALTDEELRVVLKAAEMMGHPWAGWIFLLASTGVRRSEASGARWSELFLDDENPEWRLPKQRTKNGRPHVVPLSEPVEAMLRALPRIAGSDFVFTTTGRTPVSGFGPAKKRLGKLIEKTRRKEAEVRGETDEPAPLDHWQFHDLRRTCSTGMAGLGIAPHIVEAALNHISGAKAGVAGTYNRYAYGEEKRHAFNQWSRKIVNAT